MGGEGGGGVYRTSRGPGGGHKVGGAGSLIPHGVVRQRSGEVKLLRLQMLDKQHNRVGNAKPGMYPTVILKRLFTPFPLRGHPMNQ